VNEVKKVSGALAFLFLLSSTGRADTLAQLQQRGVLRWAGDKTGGAPYIYDDRDGNLVGFETELAQYLAQRLHVRSEFVQSSWSTLLPRLNRGDIDVALNGYEWSAEREQEWSSSLPYFVYRLQLLARKNDSTLQSWDDLRPRDGKRRRVGVLVSSAAHRYLEKRKDEIDIDIEPYSEGVTSAMRLVENGTLDATLQDLPAVTYYLPGKFPGLRRVGPPVAPGYYVMFCRHEDRELLEQLNTALRAGLQDGTLQRIYEKYHLWSEDQAQLPDAWEHWPPAPPDEAEPEESPVLNYVWILAQAALITVVLSCLAMPLAMGMGLGIAVGRLFGPPWLARLLAGYVEIIRGTPLLLQLLVLYFLLPELCHFHWSGFGDIRVALPSFWAGLLGLAINYSSYEAENYRAGLLAVPPGQLEAAYALGMSPWTALRRILLPQAFRIVLPLEVNNFIALFKDTSICSVVAVVELAGQFNQLLNDHPRQGLLLGLLTACLYLLMSYPLTVLAHRLETRRPGVLA
jgi:polar amino acid transport system substrate-binding protein